MRPRCGTHFITSRRRGVLRAARSARFSYSLPAALALRCIGASQALLPSRSLRESCACGAARLHCKRRLRSAVLATTVHLCDSTRYVVTLHALALGPRRCLPRPVAALKSVAALRRALHYNACLWFACQLDDSECRDAAYCARSRSPACIGTAQVPPPPGGSFEKGSRAAAGTPLRRCLWRRWIVRQRSAGGRAVSGRPPTARAVAHPLAQGRAQTFGAEKDDVSVGIPIRGKTSALLELLEVGHVRGWGGRCVRVLDRAPAQTWPAGVCAIHAARGTAHGNAYVYFAWQQDAIRNPHRLANACVSDADGSPHYQKRL